MNVSIKAGIVTLLLLGISSTAWAAAPSWQNMFINLASTYPAVEKLLWLTCQLLGMLLMVKGIWSFKQFGDMRNMMSQQHSLKGPLMYIFAGAALLYAPTARSVIITTFYGRDASPLGYSTVGDWGEQLTAAVFGFVQLVGFVAFIRGWMLLAGSSQQGGHSNMGKAWTHIIGGILAINIMATRDILWKTFGFS